MTSPKLLDGCAVVTFDGSEGSATRCKDLEAAIEALYAAAKEVDEWISIDKHGRFTVGPGKYEPFKDALAKIDSLRAKEKST